MKYYTIWYIKEGKRICFNKFYDEDKAIEAGRKWVGNGSLDRAYEIEEREA